MKGPPGARCTVFAVSLTLFWHHLTTISSALWLSFTPNELLVPPRVDSDLNWATIIHFRRKLGCRICCGLLYYMPPFWCFFIFVLPIPALRHVPNPLIIRMISDVRWVANKNPTLGSNSGLWSVPPPTTGVTFSAFFTTFISFANSRLVSLSLSPWSCEGTDCHTLSHFLCHTRTQSHLTATRTKWTV